jgi:hypothetical protein
MKRLMAALLFFMIQQALIAQVTLDRAIGEAVIELNAKLSPGTTVAMVNFNSGSERAAAFVIEEVHRLLVQTRILTVIERRQIDLLREELNFQMSGEVSDETFQGIGHMIGLEHIITGTMERIGKVYRFRVWAVDVASARVMASYSANVQNDRVTASLMGGRAELTGLDDYTRVERHGALLLNLIPVAGIGSWTMGDWKGAVISNVLQGAGLTMVIIGGSLIPSPDRDSPEFYRPDGSFDADRYDNAVGDVSAGVAAVLITGLVTSVGGYVFNLIRPYYTHKAAPKTTALPGLAYIPDFHTTGGTGRLRLSCSWRF